MKARGTLLKSSLVVATCATLGELEALSAQREADIAAAASIADGQSLANVTVEGFVLTPGGSPIEGAVVVSSAGGKAVTDAAGKYALQVDVSPDAKSVQVTAMGRTGGEPAASANVAVGTSPQSTRLDLIAQPSPSSCSPSWLPTFGAERGADRDVLAMAEYDDGTGAALYAGGTFSNMAGAPVNRIAKWDGTSWTALGSGMSWVHSYSYMGVYALTVYDDGSGPALYAGGYFTSAGGVAAN